MTDAKNGKTLDELFEQTEKELIELIDVFLSGQDSADKKKFMLELRREFAAPVRLVSSQPDVGPKP